MEDLIITNHAKERYAERIMDKDNKTDMRVFMADHDEKINKDINKMVQYGELIYSGKSTKNPGSNTNIYLCDKWVVIVDPDKNTVVTLYAIDLGCGDEFNDEYIEKLKSRLYQAKQDYTEACESIDKTLNEYRSIIEDNEKVIAEERKLIKSLEDQNEMYKGLIMQETTNKTLAEKQVIDTILIFTSKKIW